jgi:hypothetical protein
VHDNTVVVVALGDAARVPALLAALVAALDVSLSKCVVLSPR